MTPADVVGALLPGDNCWTRCWANVNGCSAELCRRLACTASLLRLTSLGSNSSVFVMCTAVDQHWIPRCSATMREVRTRKEQRVVRATLAETGWERLKSWMTCKRSFVWLMQLQCILMQTAVERWVVNVSHEYELNYTTTNALDVSCSANNVLCDTKRNLAGTTLPRNRPPWRRLPCDYM